ncbi:MAG: hypothetical protein CFE38_00550 [Comamonadaceae bacterium PBBC1]|nr:MAG: hypothetical protein CFE38_00550 [Comamonadaceae bacterium PBBC1]
MTALASNRPRKTWYALTVRGTSCLVDSDELTAVTFKGRALPLPWACASVSGWVESDHGPLVLFNSLSTVHAKTQDQESLMAIVRSSKGLVAIEVEHVHEARGDPACDGGVKLRDLLAAILEGLSPEQWREPGFAVQDKRVTQRPETFLRVSSAGVDLAVPVDRVHWLDKHQGAYPILSGQTQEWLVKLKDDLVCAQSMRTWLGLEGSNGSEAWCLCLDEPQQSRGLLVEQVKGIITAQSHQIKVLSHLDGPATWLMLADEAPIKVLGGVLKSEPELCLDRRVCAANATAADQQAMANEIHQVLSLKVGPYQVAIPGHKVRAVMGKLSTPLLEKRYGRANNPVINLVRLLGVNSDAHPDFAVTVQFGQRDVTLLCERAEFPQSIEKFWPLPAAPSPIHDFFQSVRLDKGRCELLLRSDDCAHEWRRRVKKVPQSSFDGWLPVVGQ